MFKMIGYIFQAKKGIEKPDELVSEVSFGFIQLWFIVSFIILGIIMLILGWLGVHFDSSFFRFFSVLFLIGLTIDVWIYVKVKKFFNRTSKRIVDYSKQTYDKQKSRIIDINLNRE